MNAVAESCEQTALLEVQMYLLSGSPTFEGLMIALPNRFGLSNTIGRELQELPVTIPVAVWVANDDLEHPSYFIDRIQSLTKEIELKFPREMCSVPGNPSSRQSLEFSAMIGLIVGLGSMRFTYPQFCTHLIRTFVTYQGASDSRLTLAMFSKMYQDAMIKML